MNRTDIEYLDFTWNPTKGCSPVSEGCANCWAQRMSKRLAGMGVDGYDTDDPFAVTCFPDRLDEPFGIKKPSICSRCRTKLEQSKRVGVSFMGDLFHDEVPFEFVDAVWSRMSRCPQHTFIILTKRPKRMAEFVSEVGVFNYDVLRNVQLGVSVSNQPDADKLLPILLQIRAAVRLVSVEPLLSAIDLIDYLPDWDMPGDSPEYSPGVDWVICGSETGPGARPMEYKWAVDLFDQCQAAGVPFFSKADPSGGRLSIRGQVWEQYPEGPPDDNH